ncbi:MAG: hypothetical protein IJG84_17515 [Kiritimatiellae bacterium]|nr:hypothetical protein [Kiritimatiellia bacterium]
MNNANRFSFLICAISLALFEGCERKDGQFSVIDASNSIMSDARRAGTRMAKGECLSHSADVVNSVSNAILQMASILSADRLDGFIPVFSVVTDMSMKKSGDVFFGNGHDFNIDMYGFGRGRSSSWREMWLLLTYPTNDGRIVVVNNSFENIRLGVGHQWCKDGAASLWYKCYNPFLGDSEHSMNRHLKMVESGDGRIYLLLANGYNTVDAASGFPSLRKIGRKACNPELFSKSIQSLKERGFLAELRLISRNKNEYLFVCDWSQLKEAL